MPLPPPHPPAVAWVLAYLDPGSGALLVQMLVAGIAGVGLFLKMQGRRVMSLFGLGKKAPGEDAAKAAREPRGPHPE